MVSDLDQITAVKHLGAQIDYQQNLIIILFYMKLASGIRSATLCICKYSLDISQCRKSVPSSPSLCKVKYLFFFFSFFPLFMSGSTTDLCEIL